MSEFLEFASGLLEISELTSGSHNDIICNFLVTVDSMILYMWEVVLSSPP